MEMMENIEEPIEIRITPSGFVKGFVVLTLVGFLTGWAGGVAAYHTSGAEAAEMSFASAILPLPSSSPAMPAANRR